MKNLDNASMKYAFISIFLQGLDDDLPSFLIVYDLQSGTLFKKWRPAHNVTSVAISSKANVVVSAEEDGTIAVWDLVGGALR